MNIPESSPLASASASNRGGFLILGATFWNPDTSPSTILTPGRGAVFFFLFFVWTPGQYRHMSILILSRYYKVTYNYITTLWRQYSWGVRDVLHEIQMTLSSAVSDIMKPVECGLFYKICPHLCSVISKLCDLTAIIEIQTSRLL